MQELHVNFEIRDSGLVINPKYPFLGASPDAVPSCHCCGDIVVEIKCPYCQRDKSVSEEIDCLEKNKWTTLFKKMPCILLSSAVPVVNKYRML